MAVYWTWMVLLAAAFYAFPLDQPEGRLVTWGLIGLTSTAAVVAGVRRYRPRQQAAWWLVAAALLVFTIGDTVYNVQTTLLGQDNPFPSIADLLYQLFFALLLAGLLVLARAEVVRRDRASMLDALILTAGVGLLAWLFLINPYVQAANLTVLQRVASVSLPLWDVLILAVGAQLVNAVRKTPTVIMLAVGGVGLLISDVWYGLSQLRGAWEIGGLIDLGWIVYFAAWGAAALHPSMRSLTEPPFQRPREDSPRRLLLLAGASLIPPVVLLAEAATGTVRDAAVIAILSGFMFVLVLARLAGVLRTHREQLGRERALREAGAALVSATGNDEVTAAVCTAVAQLLPGVPHRVVLAFENTPEHDQDPAAVRLIRVPELPCPVVVADLSGFDTALRCRLLVTKQRDGGPRVGTMFVAADHAALATLVGSIPVLASSVALALERIRLTEEFNRTASEEYFRTLVHNAADVILIINDDDTVRYASPSAATVLGAGQLAGQRLHDLVCPPDRAAVDEVLSLLRSEPGRPTATADWTVLGGGGREVQVEAFCRDLRRDRTVAGLVITLRDVTEQRRLERELTHRAFHDGLTGVANRVLFQERLEHAVARSQRTGTIVGVLFLDVDDFKVVNDTMGHTIGDALLIAVCRRLTDALRPEDTAARLGGDEFAALIEDAHSPADVEAVAQRVLAALAEPFPLAGSLVSGAVSVGVATTAEAGDSHELLRQADLALYVAKGAGKGQWRRYQAALHTEVLHRMELRAALAQAVADDAFLVAYQPIVALDTGRTVGLEALLRWNHPTRGAVPPGEFIDVAEESGLIVPIGAWVMRHALADAARWGGSDPETPAPYVSINVSARQFRQSGFVAEVRAALAAAGLEPGRLVLEITESVLLRDDEQVWADLTALRDLGVRIAIDDFGTGYSSLSYLRRVPIDLVKIEKSFLDTISTSPSQLALVDGILRLTSTLGLDVVAEGIERTEDRDLLQRIGCRYGQGYLFATPLSYRDAVEWLQAEQVAA